MLRRLTAWLIALAVVANLGAMAPMAAHAPGAPGAPAALARATDMRPGMDMTVSTAAPQGQPPACPEHPAQKKALDGCGGCAFCAGAALPPPGADVRVLRFARLSQPPPPRLTLPAQDPTVPLERPPKANG